jgi:hypothetical protein
MWMHQLLVNARKIALFCVMGFSLSHAIAQVQTQEDLPSAPKKKSDTIDFLYKASPAILSAATTLDMVSTVRGLDHPTVAYREDGSVLTNYVVVEKGWARCFGNRSPTAALTANVALNAGVMILSRRLYRRGGRWRIAALGLVLVKAGANFEGGIQNERLLAGIDRQVQLSTGYTGAILWSPPQR